MLKAYRNICGISQVEFASKSGIAKGTIAKLEAASNGNKNVANIISLDSCERLARAMNMLFSKFYMLMEKFEAIPDDELNAVVYFELAKWIMEQQSKK